MSAGVLYTFGPFQLDSAARKLTRHASVVPLSDRHLDVLLCLLAHQGNVVSKDDLVAAAWPDVAVTDNSLEQAISMLRRALHTDLPPGGAPGADAARDEQRVAIETVPRRGYRFAGEVTRHAARRSDADLDALLSPHRAWLEGRAALETLGVEGAAAAERAFTRVLEAAPHHAPAHVGLANALSFRFEATRADEQPDVAALAAAVPHAREACRLDPNWGEAWATLGFVLHRCGEAEVGIAAARRAVELEPDNWRHHLRLAFVSWGEARLRAAKRTLQLMPGLALAHWLAASVHVARQAFDAAESELAAGVTAQDEQHAAAMFAGVGLHWLAGLLRLYRGDAAAAQAHFERELAFEHSGHLYARECCAGTWYAKGAMAWRDDEQVAAAEAFAQALRRVPGHPFALAAAAATGRVTDDELSTRLGLVRERGAGVDVAVANAVRAAAGRSSPDVAAIVAALHGSPTGPSGWFLPVEPILRPAADPGRWASALALVRSRAA